MNYNIKDEKGISKLRPSAIAQTELNRYLEAQVGEISKLRLLGSITPELIPLVSVNIEVERVGLTRNASNTPYLVYRVNGRRCSTFIKRRVFFDLLGIFLKLKYSIEDRIRSVTSSPYFGLYVATPEQHQYIPSSFVNKYFERYNQVALEKTAPQSCDCNDLYEMCLHSIAKLLQPTVVDQMEAKN